MSTNAALGGAASGAAAGAAVGGPYGAAIGGIGGGIFGALQPDNSGDATQMMQMALAQYANLGLPPNESGPLILQQLKANNQLTPQMEQALNSEMFQASQASDGGLSRAQMVGALNSIQANSIGGLNPQQKANQQQLLQQVNANTNSQIEGALQNQAMRGQSGSGNTLAAQLSAIQGGSQNASNNALQVGAQGQQAQSQALQQYLAGLSGMRGQDIGLSEYNSSAQQQANLAKMQNASARQARNTAATNQANQAMWQNQNYANQYNVGTANQEAQRQAAAQQQYWEDQLQLAGAKAGAYNGQAGNLIQQQQNSNQSFNTTLQGVNSLAGAYGKANPTTTGSTATPNGTDYSTATIPSSNTNFNMPNVGSQYPENNTQVAGYSMPAQGAQYSQAPTYAGLNQTNKGSPYGSNLTSGGTPKQSMKQDADGNWVPTTDGQ